MRHGWWIGLLALGLAACSSAEVPAPTVEATPRPGAPVATVAAPQRAGEPGEAVTMGNANRLEYLQRLQPPGNQSSIFNYSFSPDGTRLAALTDDLLISWDLIDGSTIFSRSRGDLTQVYFSPDRDEVYGLATNGEVIVYDPNRGAELARLRGHGNFNQSAAYNAQQGLLALGGEDGTLKVWDLVERVSLITFDAHPGRPVVRITMDASGERMASVSADGFVRIWEWREGREIANFDHRGALLEQLRFAPDGRNLYTSTRDYFAAWSVEDNELLYSVVVPQISADALLLISPDGRRLVTAGSSGEMSLWNSADGSLIAQLPEIGGLRVAADFSADGTMLITTALDRGAFLWNLSEISEETIPRAELPVGTRRLTGAAWAPDGYLLSFFDANGSVYLWGIRAAE